jgi:metal-dependent HD superfamily phosphatase/phosphodiesterase|tara:strand:+ start:261 stop:551 length:291 start_codon:yes stop_codon:yes gene_type:complete
MKKDLEAVIDQALENIKNDRQETEHFLAQLKEYMMVSRERYADAGPTAAKFVETLQRSNEQLVKIAALLYKKENTTQAYSLSEDDKNQLFDIIKED